jgi:putative zinc finger/helix-turn-helix YgiT family protein
MCGHEMKKEKPEAYHYIACGLSKTYLKGVEILVCTNPKCGEEELIIPNIEKLHDLLAHEIASQRQKLLPEEIKFLRTHLGFSGVDFAKKMGVSPESVTRWEKGQVNMKESVEKLLRVLILTKAGPFRDYKSLEEFAAVGRKTPIKRSFLAGRSEWSLMAA